MQAKEMQNSSAANAGFDAMADGVSLERRLELVDERLAALQSAIRAALADAQYARQRAAADLAREQKFGIEGFAGALLPFKDALEAALAVDTSDANALKAGLELSLRQLQAALEKHGLVEICPGPGERFDAHRHLPLVMLDADDDTRTVASTEEKGYEMHGRVLRPASVILR